MNGVQENYDNTHGDTRRGRGRGVRTNVQGGGVKAEWRRVRYDIKMINDCVINYLHVQIRHYSLGVMISHAPRDGEWREGVRRMEDVSRKAVRIVKGQHCTIIRWNFNECVIKRKNTM